MKKLLIQNGQKIRTVVSGQIWPKTLLRSTT